MLDVLAVYESLLLRLAAADAATEAETDNLAVVSLCFWGEILEETEGYGWLRFVARYWFVKELRCLTVIGDFAASLCRWEERGAGRGKGCPVARGLNDDWLHMALWWE